MAERLEPLEPTAAPDSQRAGILLVDDTPATIDSLRAILEDPDYDLVVARSGEEALEWIKAGEFAVVLLDVCLPGLSGFETAQLIRADDRSRHLPIIFLTAADFDRAQTEQGYALGAIDFCVMPFSPVAVQAKVRGLVRLHLEKQRARHEADQFRLLVQGTTDYAIFLLDPQGRVATWNAGAERLKGYTACEIIGQHFSMFYPQEAIDRGWPAHELSVAAAEDRFEDEGWRVRKDGSQFWANVVITALRDERGNLLGYSKITRDLTARKQAEENARRLAAETAARRAAEENARLIQAQRERLHVTLTSIGDAVISTDAEGHVEFLNPVAEGLVGWSSGQAAGQSLEDVFRIVNEDTRQPVENPALRALREGRIFGLANHTILISKDGTERPIDDSAAPIRNEQGDIFGSVLVFRDISERKRSEAALHEHREWLRVTLASIGDAVITTDTRGQVTFLNGVAQELTGWSEADALGQSLEAVFPILHEQTRQPVENPVEKVLRDGMVVGLGNHTVLVAKDGAEWPIDDSAAPIRDVTGRIIGVVLIFRDVTGQRRNEQHRNARLAVTQVLNQAATVPEAAGSILQAVCENLGWDVGFFWTVDQHGEEALVCRQSWHRADVPVTVFEAASCGRTFAKGEGLPGRVWATGEPAWILDISQDENFPRLVSAAGHGLHSAFACPVVAGDRLLGVIEFFTRRIREADADLLEMMGTVAGRVGQYIERRTAEEALRQSEAELADFFESATIGLHWVGADGTVLRANRAELEMLGYSRAEYVGRSIRVFHADEEVICDILRRLGAGERLRDYPARMRCQDGSLRDVLIDSSVLWKDGQFIHARCFTRDVTERRRTEQTARFLADASAALAVLVDFDSTLQKVAALAVPHFADWAAVDLIEGDGTVHRVAVAHVDPAKVALAHEVHSRFPPDPAAPQGVWNILRTGRPELVRQITDELLAESVRDDQRLRIVRELGLRSYIGVPLSVRGKTLGVFTFIAAESGRLYDDVDLAVAQDLAGRAAIAIENAQLYQELRDADRRKDEFLATLAHELRNPLAPIRTGLEVMKLSQDDPATVEEIRSTMERQTAQLIALVDDLLDVSRITQGKLELRRCRVTLADVVRSAVEASRPFIDQAGHELTVGVPEHPVHLAADPHRLAQVLSNLLNNAAKYTPEGGHIRLAAERQGGEVVVSVQDTGVGIPVEMQERIFEMFAQINRPMEKGYMGLGIGLTLVKSLVGMHGGRIEVHSEGSGKGSTFSVRLPVLLERSVEEPEPVQPAGAGDGVAAPGCRRRVLIVDDNKAAADMLRIVVRMLGHEVRTAGDGLEGVETAAEFRPDVVLMDLGMPRMNGYEAARHIRNQPWGDGVVLVALTGWGQEEDRQRTREAGFDHHLVKPAEPSELQQLLAASSHKSAQ